jgi:hypothetical protein
MGLSESDHIFDGEAEGDMAGRTVAGLGDLNGDGLADFLVGAPRASVTGGEHTGKAYVWLGGQSWSSALSDSDFVLLGEAGSDWASASVAAVDDYDGDGLPDVLVGAPRNDWGGSLAGMVYLLSGTAFSGPGELSLEDASYRFYGEAMHDEAGSTVAGIADMDGDDRGDLVIGAPMAEEGAGAVYVVGSAASLGL